MRQALTRKDARAAMLLRYEEAARTELDFQDLVKMYNKLEATERRRIRDHETARDDDGATVDEIDVYGRGVVPKPLNHPYWRELVNGDFVNEIYDNIGEMWQMMEDLQLAEPLHYVLTEKQAQALFLKAIRLADTAHIGCYTETSERAVRRLIADAKTRIRQMVARDVIADIKAGRPTTFNKRLLIENYQELYMEAENADRGTAESEEGGTQKRGKGKAKKGKDNSGKGNNGKDKNGKRLIEGKAGKK